MPVYQIETLLKNYENLHDVLMDLVDEHNKSYINLRRERERQEYTIYNLPDDLLPSLKNFLQEYYQQYYEYNGKQPKILSEDKEKQLLRGRIFEILVHHDPGLKNASHEFEVNPRTSLYPAALEILEVMKNPKRFSINEEVTRNPDGLFLKFTPNGSVLIVGSCEVKLGHLDKRSINQLLNFEQNLKSIIPYLNAQNLSRKILHQHGLQSLASHKWIIENDQPLVGISKKFMNFLIVPSNRSIYFNSTENRKKYLKKLYKELVHHDIQNLKSVWKDFLHLCRNLVILTSVFNTYEVSLITDYIYEQIKTDRPQMSAISSIS